MIIAIGLLIAFVLLVVFSNAKTRNCRWREDRTRDQDGKRYYHCLNCGHEALTDTGKPPKTCLARTPGL